MSILSVNTPTNVKVFGLSLYFILISVFVIFLVIYTSLGVLLIMLRN